MTDIITLLKNKEEKGLSMLYDHYGPALLGIIVGIVKSQKIGEDVLQQSMLKVWNNIESYDHQKGNFFTWLASVARNSAIDQIRLKGFQKTALTEPIQSQSYNLEATSIYNNQIDANSLLSKLDVKYKSVLDLIYLQGYTQQDTANVLNIPLGTVKTRLRHAINILREELKDEKDLFLGVFLFLTIIIFMLWI